MERRLTEEQITKVILSWLESNGWTIICYDFPQSGTGKIIHHKDRGTGLKNNNSIIPDIIALKKRVVVFFENKDRFYLPDFNKINTLKTKDYYTESICKALSKYEYNSIFYGIGLPLGVNYETKISKHKKLIDFLVQTDGKSTFIMA